MDAKNGNEPAPVNRTSMELKSDREIVIARTFNGPARIVFDAWTKPEFVRRWWAPKSHGVSIASCEADVRVGGRYRYVLRPDTGEEFGFSGQYTEITPYSRLVYTQIFEPMAAAGAVIVTITLDERDGRTHLVSHELYPSAQVRDAALASGMEHGMRETMDQLDALVASLL
jgi:uncharacterized protein YndB with AHSA1/START domain